MTAERSGTAHFYRAHHAQLLKRQLVRFAINFAVLPENAGQLEGWPAHALFLRLRRLLRGCRAFQPVERTYGTSHDLRRNPGVAGRRIDLAVAEQHLNDAKIGSLDHRRSRIGDLVPG